MKNTKRSMLVSGLCLLLTAVMLMGSTFAWFTDSVTNEGNQIQSGTLDVSLTPDGTQKLFDSEGFLFEPGRSQMKAVTVSNEGSLWLKYTMSFANVKVTDSKAGSNADITEVLDVYKVPGNAATAADLNETTYLGTMKSLMAAGSFAAKDKALAPKGQNGSQETFTLVIKMQESADNRYQGCGVTFDVVVNATQYNHEEDGFGNPDYDKDVTYIPDSVQEMAADLDVVSGAGTGPVGEVNTNVNTGASHAWFAPYASQAAIDYVVGFDNGEFVVRVKPNKIEGTTLSYVITNIRGENTTTDTTAKFEFPGQNSGHHEIVNYFTDMGNGWYEFRASTYGMGEEVGYIINVGYANTHDQKGEAYIRAGAGWNWDAYVQVPNECNTTKVVDDTTTLANAVTKAEPGDTIILSQNVTLTETLLVNKSITIDGNGYTICHSGEGYAFYNNAQETINLVVKNCVFEKPEGTWANTVVTGITYENCTFRGGNVYVTPTAANSGIRIVNCTFDDAMLTIDFMNTTKAELLTAELEGNTFLVKTPYDNTKMHTGVGVVFFIRDDSGYYTQDSSKVSITMEDNAFCNETGTDTFCAYQTIQTWTGSLTEASVVPVYSKNTFDEGAVYAWANYSPWAAWTAEAE